MFDPQLLRTFLVVAELLNFSRAADRLGIRQSTVSQQIRRLEDLTARPLFLRDTHSVELTSDGDAMVGFARSILDTHERAVQYFAGSQLRGRLRFGVGEDFALTRLADVLTDFRARHPLVDLALAVELSGALHEKLRQRQLDLVLAKRRPGETHGQLVWREELCWVGAPGTRIDSAAPVSLVVYPPPSITREQAFEVLGRHRREWRVTCTASGLSGVCAAVAAGLGIALFSRSLIPPGLHPLAEGHDLPEPGFAEFVLLTGSGTRTRSVAALTEAVVSAAARLRAESGIDRKLFPETDD